MVGLEDLFVTFLGTPKRLGEYIEANTDLSAYINDKYSNYIKTAKILIPNYRDLVEGGKTMDWVKVLAILSRRRPELWRIIILHPRGLEWFKSQRFKDFLQ